MKKLVLKPALAAILLCLSAISIHAVDTLVVTKITDPDPFLYPYNYIDSLCHPAMYGTLQWAFRKANDSPGAIVIVFNIAGTGPHIILLNTQLPVIFNQVILDGTSQNGYQYGYPQIIIDGQNKISSCFYFAGYPDVALKGIHIRNFNDVGVMFGSCSNYTAIDNFITNIANTSPALAAIGIRIYQSNGVIKSNFVGTSIDLLSDQGIENYGIYIQFADNNIVGGTGLDEGNTVAYCGSRGILIGNSNLVRISGNRIFNNPVGILLGPGANMDKPAPVITGFTATTVTGTSQPGDIIEIFGSTEAENANEYLASVTADGAGNWTANVTTSYGFVVATATDAQNNTSVFSYAQPITVLPVTKLSSEFCGVTGVALDAVLYAETVIGAIQYEFNIINNEIGFNQIYTNNEPILPLAEITELQEGGITYEIRVKPVFSTMPGVYGDICTITTFDPFEDLHEYENSIIFDRFGNIYTIQDITINPDKPGIHSVTEKNYHIDFDDPNGLYTTAIVDVIEQVFDDISFLIDQQECGTTEATINYLFQPVSIPNSLGSTAASSFYIPQQQACCSLAIENTGIIESEVWKAINTGINDPNLFDAIIGLNLAAYNWNTSLVSGSTQPGQADLYSVVLHEVLHTLGFASLITGNGISMFAPGFQMFSRYDLFLFDNSSNSYLLQPSGLYSYFPANSAVLYSGCNNIRFHGNFAVNEPIADVGTGMLSHFDENCLIPPYTNNMMFPGLDILNGEERRTILSGEANVLLDLGYEITGQFGDGTMPHHNLNLPTGGPGVIGITDGNIGLNSACTQVYNIQLCPNTPWDVNLNNIINNDINTQGFIGIQLLEGNGVISPGPVYTPNQPGIHTLRYIPVDANGNKGNYTCIYINALPCIDNCLHPDTCNLTCNPDFDCTGSSCGNALIPQNWIPSHGTPDCYNYAFNQPNPWYLRMAAHPSQSNPNGWSEGALTPVNIIQGNTYLLSYYRRIGNLAGGNNNIENLFVKLISQNTYYYLWNAN
ncbi:MAG: hypothetical protein HY738_11590, partial [Bacteroidia bacterium]|nr:hypothetical protein [Bacteroidia bacterium]